MLPASLANPAAFFITAAVLHVIVLLGREEVLEWVKGYLLLDELGDLRLAEAHKGLLDAAGVKDVAPLTSWSSVLNHAKKLSAMPLPAAHTPQKQRETKQFSPTGLAPTS